MCIWLVSNKDSVMVEKYSVLKTGVFTFMLIISFLWSSYELFGQQDSQYTQYMYNTQVINPAYAGTRAVFSASSLYRAQWIGLKSAPRTLNLAMAYKLGLGKRDYRSYGLGISIVSDQYGPTDESSLVSDFSYAIPLGARDVKIAFGLKAGINLLNVDYNKLDIYDPTDGVFRQNIDNRLTPIIGAGVFLHDDESYYIGLSIPNFLETYHFDDHTVSNSSEKANVYLMGGYVFDLRGDFMFKPATLIRVVPGAPVGVDISANLLYKKKLDFGVSYRFGASVSALSGFQISDEFLIGYAYDHSVTSLANHNSGTHEVFLRYELGRPKQRKYTTPRFF